MLKAKLVPSSIVLFVALAVFAHTPTKAGSWDVDVNFLLGAKYLNSDWETPWENYSTMVTFGVNTSWAPKEWPVRIAVDVFLNFHFSLPTIDWGYGGGGYDGSATGEWAFGVRKIWKSNSVRPYLGGGLTVTSATQGIADGSALGEWVDGGVFWRLGSHFDIGVDLRYSWARPELGGRKIEAGGLNTCLTLGFGF
jgi:hypothetical protein